MRCRWLPHPWNPVPGSIPGIRPAQMCRFLRRPFQTALQSLLQPVRKHGGSEARRQFFEGHRNARKKDANNILLLHSLQVNKNFLYLFSTPQEWASCRTKCLHFGQMRHIPAGRTRRVAPLSARECRCKAPAIFGMLNSNSFF